MGGMRPINIRMIEAFRAVYLAGTTSAASELLNITQPAISRHIMALEGRLGFSLFNRESRRLKPTPEADLMIELANSAYGEIERFSRLAEDVRAYKRGYLRILASTTMARGLVPNALAGFQKMYPNIAASVDLVVRGQIAERVVAQQFDIALVGMPIDYPTHKKKSLPPMEAVAILPRAHPLAALEVISTMDFQDHPFISLGVGVPDRVRIDRAFEKNTRSSKHYDGSSNPQHNMRLCRSRLGRVGDRSSFSKRK